MIKPICRNLQILAQKARPATKQDIPLAKDLLETLAANSADCVGMAANSLDGQRPATRYQQIVVEYFDLNWQKQSLSLTGFAAEAVQHELDHCNGIII